MQDRGGGGGGAVHLTSLFPAFGNHLQQQQQQQHSVRPPTSHQVNQIGPTKLK